MAKQRDYYEILGVSKTASADELRKAHRKLVRQYHPDVNKNNPRAEERFKEIQEAYDVLSDTTKRQRYDQFGHAGVGGTGMPPGGDPFEAFRRAQQQQGSTRSHTWRGGPNVTVEDFDFGIPGGGGNEQFADLFEQMFGGGRGSRRGQRAQPQPQPQRGADVEYPVTLSFEQAARGTTLPLQIRRGGKLDTIDVKIPPGVKEGSRVRIRGHGEQANGEPGDLYIITKVRPHDYFRRDDMDVYLDLPLSLYEAMLGTKVDVPTLDGPVQLTIPSGTSSGAKLRIKGRGIERGGQRGDQFVVTRVMVPKELDAEDHQLLQKLAGKHPLNARADVKW